MSESSFVFLLRGPNQELEIMYNQQQDQVIIAEAQLFVKGDHIEGGCLFFIDNLYDMDKLISYLGEIRGKMDKHYAACAGIMPAGEVLGVSDSIGAKIAAGPYCTQCGKSLSCQTQTEQEKKLCFDCEKKQIIKAADSFNPENFWCVVKHCQNNAEPGSTKCFIHQKPTPKDVQ